MKKKFNTYIYIILLSQTTFAQTNVISGKIVDENNKPIPYVHVRVENTDMGTISNENGLFKLLLSKDIDNKATIISTLGYQTKKVFLKEVNHIIQLAPEITSLQEIIITTSNRGKELIKNAIAAIPKNYPKFEERHTGFFRELTYWKEQQPIYITETLIESVKRPYVNMHKRGDVKIVEFRKYESKLLDSLDMRIYAGAHHIHRFDIVSRRAAFLRNPNAYKYKITDTLQMQGKDVFKIHFRNKDKLSGNVYILDSSYAIIKANFNHHLFTNLLPSNRHRKYLNYTVSYEQGNDKVWRFKHSNYETAFKRNGGEIKITSEYVTTQTEPNKTDIAYLDKLQYGDILLNESTVYKPNFWDNYNIILPNKKHEDLFKSINHSKKERHQNKSKKWATIFSRLRQEISFTMTPVDIASNRVSFNNTGLNITQSLSSSRENVYGISYSLLYELKPNFFLGYAGETKISKNGVSSYDLSLIRRININPNKRPLFVILGINFGYQKNKHFLGDFNVLKGFNVNGKSFGSGKTAVFLSQKNIRLQPKLSLSFEKNHNFNFKFAVGYNIPFNKKSGLVFQEKEGFFLFRKNTFVENGTGNLAIEHSDDLIKNNVSISAGMSYRL